MEATGGQNNGRKCPNAHLIRHDRWIENLNPTLKLKDLVLPGAHHHGLYEGGSKYIGILPDGKLLDWSVTQSLNVIDQLLQWMPYICTIPSFGFYLI